MIDFIGVKVALLFGDKLLVIQRDDKPGLRYAGLWDFPGGAREEGETPFACLAREVKEELNIDLAEDSVVWQKTYPAMQDPKLTAYFMVAAITNEDVAVIKFGDEGQGWKLMAIDEFMQSNEVVEPLKGRLEDYLASLG